MPFEGNVSFKNLSIRLKWLHLTNISTEVMFFMRGEGGFRLKNPDINQASVLF